MSQARVALKSRLETIRTSLQEASVSDGVPADTMKNAVAALMRSGLAVLIFATLEAFIRDRTGEVLRGFSATNVSFNSLSEKLQTAVTLSALQGILFRAKQKDKIDQVNWLLTELQSVANAASSITTLSPYSFGQSSSNISDEVIKTILSAFGIERGWSAISEVAKHIGLGGVADYSQAFREIAKRRHSAAHDVSINIPLNDLEDGLKSVLALCCSFDLLVSHSLSRHNIGKNPALHGAISHTDLKYRFLSPHPSRLGSYREQYRNGSTAQQLRTWRVHQDFSSAKSAVQLRMGQRQEQLLILGANGLPDHWETW